MMQVFALGFVSVFDQVLDGMPEDTGSIFKAYIEALDEDSSKYRQDADKLASQAKELTKSSELTPEENGNEVRWHDLTETELKSRLVIIDASLHSKHEDSPGPFSREPSLNLSALIMHY